MSNEERQRLFRGWGSNRCRVSTVMTSSSIVDSHTSSVECAAPARAHAHAAARAGRARCSTCTTRTSCSPTAPARSSASTARLSTLSSAPASRTPTASSPIANSPVPFRYSPFYSCQIMCYYFATVIAIHFSNDWITQTRKFCVCLPTYEEHYWTVSNNFLKF